MSSAVVGDARQRLSAVLGRGARFERDGFPLGSLDLRNRFEEAVRSGTGEELVVRQAADLVELAERRWTELRRRLAEWDDLRSIAEEAGLDVARVDARAGNPRAILLGRPVSDASVDAALRSATIALATLEEALPRYCVEQARALGLWARDARARGAAVSGPVAAVARIVEAIHGLDLAAAARAIAEARAEVVKAALGGGPPSLPADDEERIVVEAHALARRVSGTEESLGSSRVRAASAALDRSGGWLTPEAEVEALWEEVERMGRARDLASGHVPTDPEPVEVSVPPVESTNAPRPALATPVEVETAAPPGAPPAPESVPMPAAPPVLPDPAPETPTAESGPTLPPAPATAKPSSRVSFASAYVPPDPIAAGGSRGGRSGRSAPRRGRSRHRT